MTKSGSENEEVLKAAEAALQESGETVIMAVRGSKNRGIWGVSGRLARHMSKPRVIALTTRSSSTGQRAKADLHVLKHSSGGVLQPAKVYKLKHLAKVEVLLVMSLAVRLYWDLITLKVKVFPLRNGQCVTLMTGIVYLFVF